MNKQQILDALEVILTSIAKEDIKLFEEVLEIMDGLYLTYILEEEDKPLVQLIFDQYIENKPELNKIFDKTTQKIQEEYDLFSFGEVLDELQMGTKWKRKDWKNSYIQLNNSKIYFYAGTVCTRYTPSNEDMLSEDWILVNKDK